MLVIELSSTWRWPGTSRAGAKIAEKYIEYNFSHMCVYIYIYICGGKVVKFFVKFFHTIMLYQVLILNRNHFQTDLFDS